MYYRLEINGKPHNVAYGEQGSAVAHARAIGKRKRVRQVRVYECSSVDQLLEHVGGRCIMHIGKPTVRKTA